MKITESKLITSKDNARIKLARAVRDGREKELIYLEGVRLASELLKSDLKAQSIFISGEAAERMESLVPELVRSSGVDVFVVADRVFDSISDTNSSQGIVVLAGRPRSRVRDDLKEGTGGLVYLSKINNPSNLGAVMRTAEAAGARGIITSPGSADPFSPKALRASMGSAFRLPVYMNVSINDAVAFARGSGVRTVAADVSARKSYTETDWRAPAMLIFGSEAHGLNAEELAMMDEVVQIPMDNSVESLNIAVSVGILLFEAKRQRGAI